MWKVVEKFDRWGGESHERTFVIREGEIDAETILGVPGVSWLGHKYGFRATTSADIQASLAPAQVLSSRVCINL